MPYREKTVKLKNHNSYLLYIQLIAFGSILGWIKWEWLEQFYSCPGSIKLDVKPKMHNVAIFDCVIPAL